MGDDCVKRVCIHQPDFLPYLGFFHRLLSCDTFVILDDVQFLRRGWHHRDKIKTPAGVRWLSLSVKKGDYQQQIKQVCLSNGDEWIESNLNLIRENYRKAPYFEENFPSIEAIYRTGFDLMIDLNLAFLNYFYVLFETEFEVVLSSDLRVEGRRNEKLKNLVSAVGGNVYLSGLGARSYLDEEVFQKAGISVEWQEFQHPVYSQLQEDFIPNLSCLDVLLNSGPDSKDVLWSSRSPE